MLRLICTLLLTCLFSALRMQLSHRSELMLHVTVINNTRDTLQLAGRWVKTLKHDNG